MSKQPQVKYRKDYQPPIYLVKTLDLDVELYTGQPTVVYGKMHCTKNIATPDGALVLHGNGLKLKEIHLDGKALSDKEYTLDSEHLTLNNLPKDFVLETWVEIEPEKNTALEGLYTSGGMFCTQCESHGFRRITFMQDRPDVMCKFTTRLSADKTKFPILLSNGNKIDSGDLEDNRHYAVWEDPFKKPSYLFALVAGDLACLKDKFTTQSGRVVDLEVYVREEDLPKTDFAMQALKDSMRWDEETYGLEYDLDIYMIVAVSDFNMGAMENKGLNIFNTKYVLADSKTATDTDFEGVQGVIGHEYFHNWTGNRVTCQDWFQLSLKEGLTVYRDQRFTADMTSETVKRIADVKIIRTQQFAEDASPMAHPIRPDSYIEMNNFYTVTVYNKGAEIVRMYETLLDKEGFRDGMDLYFERHDGQAVTCDDFTNAMADANFVDLTQFKRWYSQAKTPTLIIKDHYNAESKVYTLTMSQRCEPTGDIPAKPFHIPVKVGLLRQDGRPIMQHVFELKKETESFPIRDLNEKPIPSLLRDFSAPVKLEYDYTPEMLSFLLANDSNEFNRWDAGQKLATHYILEAVKKVERGEEIEVNAAWVSALKSTLINPDLDKALIAEVMTLPSELTLAQEMEAIDVYSLHTAYDMLFLNLAHALEDVIVETYLAHHNTGEYKLNKEAVAKRRLKNTCLNYMAYLTDEKSQKLIENQFKEANNMTDQLAALNALVKRSGGYADEVLDEFYRQWKNEALVMDKWLTVQALSSGENTLDKVKSLVKHPVFDIKNPNKVYALLVAFANNNLSQFHQSSGAGYTFIVEQLKIIDPLNPQVAARLVRSLMNWRRFDESRQVQMKKALETILDFEGLSKDVYEIVSKSLH